MDINGIIARSIMLLSPEEVFIVSNGTTSYALVWIKKIMANAL
jgi:hypothetical protein